MKRTKIKERRKYFFSSLLIEQQANTPTPHTPHTSPIIPIDLRFPALPLAPWHVRRRLQVSPPAVVFSPRPARNMKQNKKPNTRGKRDIVLSRPHDTASARTLIDAALHHGLHTPHLYLLPYHCLPPFSVLPTLRLSLLSTYLSLFPQFFLKRVPFQMVRLARLVLRLTRHSPPVPETFPFFQKVFLFLERII